MFTSNRCFFVLAIGSVLTLLRLTESVVRLEFDNLDVPRIVYFPEFFLSRLLIVLPLAFLKLVRTAMCDMLTEAYVLCLASALLLRSSRRLLQEVVAQSVILT